MSKEVSQLKSKKFIFIVGRGRSGTTLLRLMLNGNKNISIAPESLFMLHAASKYKLKKFDFKTIKSFNKDIWRESRLKNWRLNKKITKNILKNALNEKFDLASKLIYFLNAIKNYKNSAKILGDKNPLYSLYLNHLLRIFPQAKIIHVIRDYHSNIASFKNLNFESTNSAALAYRWKKYNEEILKVKKRNKKKFITIKYEDLINNPEKKLKIICKFLNLQFERKMMEFYKYQNPNIKWHKNLKKPVDKKMISKWKKQLNYSDLNTIEKICGELGKKYKYNNKKINDKLTISECFGIFIGWLRTELEMIFFKLPIQLRIIYFKIQKHYS